VISFEKGMRAEIDRDRQFTDTERRRNSGGGQKSWHENEFGNARTTGKNRGKTNGENGNTEELSQKPGRLVAGPGEGGTKRHPQGGGKLIVKSRGGAIRS